VHPGEVQVMSAGRGIMHSEFNHSKEKPVHFFQLWIMPRKNGNKPRWEQKQFAAEDRVGRLLPVVSDGSKAGSLAIDQDATIYVSSLKAGQSIAHQTRPDRRTYLFVSQGELKVNDATLSAGDQARIGETPTLKLSANKDVELILLDLP